MATYQNGGRSSAPPDEHRGSWRPQDQPSQNYAHGNEDDRDYRSWRDRNDRDEPGRHAHDPRRWEGSRGSELGYRDDREGYGRSTERYGQGQSGYSAGRYGDDRSQGMQNRNEMMPAGYEDRAPELGTDDRFTGRGRSPFWQDRQDRGYDPERYGAQGGYGGGRGFEPERLGPSRGSAGEGYGREDRIGYLGNAAPGSRHMGYDSTASGWSPNPGYHQRQGGEGGSTQRDRETGQHMHRSTGPHRGKGPAGYQRSDERLREMICEQLADDDQLDASGIEVTVKNGEVTLSGSVDDRRAKRDAEDCACTVSGIRDIQNQLRIRDDRQAGRPSFAGSSNAGQSSTGQSQKIETETGTDKKHRA